MLTQTPSDVAAPTKEETPTFGMLLAGVSFNPSGDAKVNQVKNLFAQLADIVESAKPANDTAPSYLFNLIKGNALREILNAQMNAVKLITLK